MGERPLMCTHPCAPAGLRALGGSVDATGRNTGGRHAEHHTEPHPVQG